MIGAHYAPSRMRPGLAIFALALVLLGAAVLARSSQSSVEDTYRGWLQGHVDRDAERICTLTAPELRDGGMPGCVAAYRESLTPDIARRWQVIADVAVVDVHVDGDSATATLRSGSCTLAFWTTEFRRSSGGEWRYGGIQVTNGLGPPCLERGAKPPAGFPDLAAVPALQARG